MTTIQTETRNADLGDLAAILQTQHAAKLDVVAPAAAVEARDGLIVVTGTEAVLDADGVTSTDGVYRPTAVFDEGVASKLGIPTAYLRRTRDERVDLYDANVNGWLHGHDDGCNPTVPGDGRSFLLRLYRGQAAPFSEPVEGVARAFLSDGYKIIDNLDVLTAALDGVRASGAETAVDSCDLTERKMRVRLVAPGIQALAPVLLNGYRSPFDHGQTRAGAHRPAPWDTDAGRAHGWLAPSEQPVVFAGVEIANSETGGGAYTITPRLVVKVCRNGLTISVDALRSVHLGARQDEGVVRWSAETQEQNLALVRSMARDAMVTFLDVDYVAAKVAEIEEKAGRPVGDAEKTVKTVTQRLRFTEAQQADVLAHFIVGGQMTAAGVVNAITSAAQGLDDADEAARMEEAALRALDLVGS